MAQVQKGCKKYGILQAVVVVVAKELLQPRVAARPTGRRDGYTKDAVIVRSCNTRYSNSYKDT